MRPRSNPESSRPKRCNPTATDSDQTRGERIDQPLEIRNDKVNRVRAAIAEGSYDEETLLEQALDGLAGDIGVVCPDDDGDG